jgi:hypothetical protein
MCQLNCPKLRLLHVQCSAAGDCYLVTRVPGHATRVLQGCNKGATRVLQGWTAVVSCDIFIDWNFKGFLRKLFLFLLDAKILKLLSKMNGCTMGTAAATCCSSYSSHIPQSTFSSKLEC